MPDTKRTKHIRRYPLLAVLILTMIIGMPWLFRQSASALSGSLICGQEEHTHGEECYESKLSCGVEENDTHTHTEQCYTKELVCTKPEHVHGDGCYETTEPKPEQPDPEQPKPEPEQPEQPQEGDDLFQSLPEILRQGVPADYTDVRTAALPHGGAVYLFSRPGVISRQVELRVQVLDPAEPLFAQAQQRVQETGIMYDYFAALDISLIDENGAEVEPQEPVYVSIDAAALLPRESLLQSVRIQHHKYLSLNGGGDTTFDGQKQPETVLDDSTGVVTQKDDTGSWVATFSVDSFSVYTVTSAGWTNLNIKIECVDEDAGELLADHKPADIVYDSSVTSQSAFTIEFTRNNHPNIPNYQYDGKTYYMENGEYKFQIFGLRRQDSQWYYYSDHYKDGPNGLTRFEPQPNFEGDNPTSTLRSVYKKIMQIPVLYLDDVGNTETGEIRINEADAPGGKNPDTITHYGTTLTISDTDVLPKCDKYFFVGKAYVNEAVADNEVHTVIRKGGIAHAITQSGEEVKLSEDVPLKLLYHMVCEIPETLGTVSTRDKGMTINLFAYNTGDNCGPNDGINAGKKLQFVNDMSRPEPYNKWTGNDAGLYTGMVKKELDANGYPVMADSGESLAYLFDPALCNAELNNTIKHVHTNLDHLFWRDSNGYYHYDSMTNFATIMDPNADGGGHSPEHNDGGNFTVYRQPVLPGVMGTGNNPKFLPFNTYEQANRPTAEPANSDKVKAYHFGMTIATDFNMPTGGVVPDASGGFSDMIFEFNGDDDVWVFIDDKLVLDLGGIHDRYGGTINFRTGEVITNAPFSAHSGRRQPNLYGIEDVSGMTPEQLDAIREEKGFGRFTTHNIKFFYLERGRGASNCEIRFNLVPVEHGLIIGKRVPAELDDTLTGHTWYQFQAEAEHGGIKHPLANAKYEVIKWVRNETDHINGGKLLRTETSDENGRFWLRPGERADFSGAVDLKHAGTSERDKITIYVSEIFGSDEMLPKVTAWSGNGDTEGSYLVVTDKNGNKRKLSPALYDSEENQFHTKKTETQVSSLDMPQEVICQAVTSTGRNNQFNWMDFENDLGAPAGLTVTKKAYHVGTDVPIPDQPFRIKIELWDERKDSWEQMEAGAAYWYLNGNETEPAPNAQPQHMTQEQNGEITLKHDQTVFVKLVPGTRYRVMELMGDEGMDAYTPVYEGKVQNPENEPEELEIYEENQQQVGIGNSSGIKAGSRHSVVITNHGDITVPPELYIKKVVEGFAPADMLFDIQIKIGKSADQLQPLPKDTFYTLISNGTEENRTVEGENGVIQIHGGEIIHLTLEQDTVYSVEEINQNKGFEVEYGLEIARKEWTKKVSDKPLEPALAQKNEIHTVTVTNRGNAFVTPKGSFVLEKQVTGPVLPPENTQFPFVLGIVDFATDQNSGGYKPSIDCQITYYGTPAGERGELGTPQNGALTGEISFKPEKIQGEGTPSAGSDYAAQLFLYSGESAVITGLPEGYSMSVHESLSQEDEENYSVSFKEASGKVTAGNVLPATEEKLNGERVLEVLCVNESKLQPSSALQITKIVKRTDRPGSEPAEEDKKDSFTFKVTLKEPAVFNPQEVQAELKKEDGTVTAQTLSFKQKGKDYVTELSLKHGETIVIKGLPSGIDVVVQETGHKGYTVSMNQRPEDTVTVHLRPNSGTPYEVRCVNVTGAGLPATGGYGVWPLYLAGTVMMAAAIVALILKKRRSR